MKVGYLSPPRGAPNAEPRGVILRMQQVVHLLQHVQTVRDAVAKEEDLLIHVGECCYVRVQEQPRLSLDLRDYFFPEKGLVEPVPTKRGVRLYGLEIDEFLELCLPKITEVWPELKDKKPCHQLTDTNKVACYNCNPKLAGTPRHLKA